MNAQFPVAPSYGLVGYNGIVLPGTYQLKLNSTAIYNPDNVTLKYYVNTLTVEVILTQELTGDLDPNGIDNAIAKLRFKLQEPRKQLWIAYQGSGLGQNGLFIYPNTEGKKAKYPDVLFDATGNPTNNSGVWINDVGGGPLPKTLNWEPVGVNKACAITWTVEFYTLRCPYGDQLTNDTYEALLAFEADFETKVNAVGQVINVISGYIEWPFTIADPLIQDFRTRLKDQETIFIQLAKRGLLFDRNTPQNLPPNRAGVGLIVTQFDTKQHKNGRRIDFYIVLEYMHSINDLFPNTVKIDAKHSLSSSLTEENALAGSGFFSWLNRLRVSVTLPANTNPEIAFYVFTWIFWTRFARIKSLVNASQNEETPTGATPRNIILSLELEEDIYSQTHNFSVDWTGIYKLDNLLEQSGMFYPVYTIVSGLEYPWETNYIPNKDLQKRVFHTTVTGTYTSRYTIKTWGRSEQLSAGRPFVFDPCADVITENVPSQSETSLPKPYGDEIVFNSNTGTITPGQDSTSNYLAYHVEFEIIENPRTYPIGIQQSSQAISNYKITDANSLKNNNPYSTNPQGVVYCGKTESSGGIEEPSAITADSGGSDFIIVLKGYGIRYNNSVPVPALLDYRGQALKRVGNPNVKVTQFGVESGALHITKWEIPYHVPRALSGSIVLNDGGSQELREGGRFMPSAQTTQA